MYVRTFNGNEGYDGTNLRIPYRFQEDAFTEQHQHDIQKWLDELSSYLGGCIEFYHEIVVVLIMRTLNIEK